MIERKFHSRKVVMSVSLSLIFICCLLIGYIYSRLKKNYTHFQRKGIPCEKPNFFLGNVSGVRTTRSFIDIWLSYYRKFKGSGPFAGFYWFHRPSVFVLEPSLAKLILIKDFNKFTDRNFFSNEKDDPLSGHLFLLNGRKWRRMRNKLSPAFTSRQMKFMFPTVIKIGHEFVSVFKEMVLKDCVIDVKELMARFTTDVIGTCAFGINCNSLKDPEAEFRVMGRRALNDTRNGQLGIAFLGSFPELARKLHMKQTPEHIEKFFLRIVRETVAQREQNNIKRNDFMDLLIDLKNNKLLKSGDDVEFTNLTLEEIAAQAFVFFAAGFETSSTAMGFALYELAQHPDIQQKARNEINSVLEHHAQEFTFEAIKELKYLDQILSETLRLYTVSPVINRQCVEDYEVPGHPNYVIKKGMPIIIPAAAFHRDADYYPNPDEFNPDNFLPELVKERDSILWLPFGEGPRNCIGMRFGQMQACVGLAMLLKNFKFSVCPKTQIPMVYNKLSYLIASESGIYLKVENV